MYCACHHTLNISTAIALLWDEVKEFVAKPSRDEFSDICWAMGRLLGALTGVPYRFFPGDSLHKHKIAVRMSKYGCVRSPRHLRNGKCPTRSRLE